MPILQRMAGVNGFFILLYQYLWEVVVFTRSTGLFMIFFICFDQS